MASATNDQPPRCERAADYRVGESIPGIDELRRNHSLVLRRPLWMLPEPRPLAIDRGRPLCEGPLTLLEGPERLETGWWDDAGIARDYFVACNPRGMHLWVFRNRGAKGEAWFLHGMFG